MTIQRPRGTRDFLPDEAFQRAAVRRVMQDLLERWGYLEVSTPTFEKLELFTIKSGQSIIDEIYVFEDKGGRGLALRPELTAPLMRMYVNELQNAPKPLRLHYFGNCFRYERPQRGRFREFWQLGVELIGSEKPDPEAEVIALAHDLLKSVNVPVDLHVGHLGLIRAILGHIPAGERPAVMRFIDKKERQLLAEKLEEIGAGHLGLDELIDLNGQGALDKAMDLAEELDRISSGGSGSEDAISSGRQESSSSDPSASSADPENGRSARSDTVGGVGSSIREGLEDFQELVDILDCYGVEAVVDFEIVRGLEFYTGTVFEAYATGLGAQNQLCGGGTYHLAGLLGGKETSSTGFGIGFDRIMEVARVDVERPSPVVLAFVPSVRAEAIEAAKRLRRSFPVVLDVMGRSLGAQMKYASAIGARQVVILGPKEVESGELTLRDMESGAQESLRMETIEERLS